MKSTDLIEIQNFLQNIIKLKLTQRQTNVLLAWFHDDKDKFDASNKVLAERTGINSKTITREIDALVEYKILFRSGKKGLFNHYKLNPAMLTKKGITIERQTTTALRKAKHKRVIEHDESIDDGHEDIEKTERVTRVGREIQKKIKDKKRAAKSIKKESPIKPIIKRADGEVFRGEDGRILIVSGERINRAGDEDIITFMDNEGGHSEYEIFLKIREPLHLKNPDYIKRFKKMRRED